MTRAAQQQRQERILDVFRRYPGVKLRGLDVVKMASSGPFLAGYHFALYDLENTGILASEWEADPHSHVGVRTRRRVYWLKEGQA